MTAPTLILFAKTPIPGEVKTRLQPQLSAEQAAAMAAELIDISARNASQWWPGKTLLSAWPTVDHPVFERVSTHYDIGLRRQAPGDLGAKMHAALEDNGYPAAVMGCDVPHCPQTTLRLAFDTLAAGQNVIGPSEDGGYYLLGLCASGAQLFKGVAWGGAKVRADTKNNARAAGIEFVTLPELKDIDTWEDLAANPLPLLSCLKL